MFTTEIRTTDTSWATDHGRQGTDGRTEISVQAIGFLQFAGRTMIRFDITDRGNRPAPIDAANVHTQLPAEWLTGIRVQHMTAAGRTITGMVTIDRVVAMNDGTYRLECQRTGGGTMHVYVTHEGDVIGEQLASADTTRLADRNGDHIPCHHAWHYGDDGLPKCRGDECTGQTVGCGQGVIDCLRHAPADVAPCADCAGTGAVPAGGGEPADVVDNGMVPCPTCAPRERLDRVRTPDLRVGDIVTTHGMRVLLDETPRVFGVDGRDVVSVAGTVTNLADVLAAGVVPASFLYHWDTGHRTVLRRDRWVIQGNELATWSVERIAATAAV